MCSYYDCNSVHLLVLPACLPACMPALVSDISTEIHKIIKQKERKVKERKFKRVKELEFEAKRLQLKKYVHLFTFSVDLPHSRAASDYIPLPFHLFIHTYASLSLFCSFSTFSPFFFFPLSFHLDCCTVSACLLHSLC